MNRILEQDAVGGLREILEPTELGGQSARVGDLAVHAGAREGCGLVHRLNDQGAGKISVDRNDPGKTEADGQILQFFR